MAETLKVPKINQKYAPCGLKLNSSQFNVEAGGEY